MALKKSELYSSLWASCDELRGGMDASQYKDYVLVLLFIKYVSDKYAGQPYAPITIPKGASFKDMVALKGKSDIGDQINKNENGTGHHLGVNCLIYLMGVLSSWRAVLRVALT
jgi:type I restriction enzyme M protein